MSNAASVPSSSSTPVRRGGVAAFLGIALVALGLLTAVTSYSPLAQTISGDIGLTDVTYGLLGTLAPFTFALVSLVTPFVARRITLEWTVLIAAALIGGGQIIRAFAGESAGFFVWSIVGMVGIAASNLLLPPLVKRFFPDRIVSVSTVYLTLMVISTIYPPLLAVPLAEWAGWRVSIGVWGLVEVLAIVPWLVTIVMSRKTRGTESAGRVGEDSAGRVGEAVSRPEPNSAGVARRVWSHPTSWLMLVMYAMATMNFYVIVQWLPPILGETVGLEPAAAGALLSLYSAVGIPIGFFIAPLVAKARNLGVLYMVVAVIMTVGYLGLWFAPGELTWLWVILVGVAPTIFSITLVATNFRTSTEAGGVTLTGMVAFGGYLLGAFAPVLVGVFAQNNLPWAVTYGMLIGSAVVVFGVAFGLRGRVNVDQPR